MVLMDGFRFMKQLHRHKSLFKVVLGVTLCLTACTDTNLDASNDSAQDNTYRNASIEKGVPLTLAQARAERISNLTYDLDFTIPAGSTAEILAKAQISFNLSNIQNDLLLDFKEEADHVKSVSVNAQITDSLHKNEHLIIPANLLKSGQNIINIDFIAGDTSLNRNPDFLYTLFVPDRARTAFPVFDQPNLKARYNLTLNVPENWQVLGNGPLESLTETETGKRYKFETSDLISSYLFSFVAGEFETITRTLNGREMTMLHRETDPEKIARNVDAIFQAHADALAWLETYTDIPYPFKKFDFAAIPGFQYGGMEHVGAVQYRASTLFLDADPSDPQRLNRANLIAHEVAHMWFGDLVTMDWFNDVWTKEVFANFMAAKIVNPSFPNIDHDLNFLLRSYPAAYSVDRTQGSNPIRQDLPNLNEAGTLYGAIIYNKAPIMMQQLELLLGEDKFRDGMREYLSTYSNKNATWPNLIEIFDRRSDEDLKAWSEVWVNTAGRPHFKFKTNDEGIEIIQTDPEGKNRYWPQSFDLSFPAAPNDLRDIQFLSPDYTWTVGDAPEDILMNITGRGYGLFPINFDATHTHWADFNDLQKGAQLINIYEQMLEGHSDVTPEIYFDFLSKKLNEPNELLLNATLRQLRQTYRSYLSAEARTARIESLETQLWQSIENTALPASTRKIYFRTLQSLAQTDDSLERLKAIWSETATLDGISLSQREKSNLAAQLAIKLPSQSETIITQHLTTLKNPDEMRRFAFISPALSSDISVRDKFFKSLKDVKNRANENWTLVALSYLHHPTRTDHSQAYITPSLELLEEIQATGDIFFPGRPTLQSSRFKSIRCEDVKSVKT